MPQIDSPPASPTMASAKTIHDIFSPVTKSHILNCSYPKWHPVYRTLTPKTRIVPLTPEFLAYIREDGIILPSDEGQVNSLSDSDDSDDEPVPTDSDSEDDSDDSPPPPQKPPPNSRFPELHAQIKATIAELGGSVAPKLNWSSPKDALFMSPTNTLECKTPGEIYLLLKSSDFVTHDLEHAFDDCIDTPLLPGEEDVEPQNIPYSLVLRKWFQCNPSMEFRCFVRDRQIRGITQRDLNHFEFLTDMKADLLNTIHRWFDKHLKDSFPDKDFVFDVYVPSTEGDSGTKKVWLMDINPFAPRTDPVLFSWLELLDNENVDAEPEIRIVKKGDPESYSFNRPQYSTSKLPQEVVEAGLSGEEAIWEFASRWRDVTTRMENSRISRDENGASGA